MRPKSRLEIALCTAAAILLLCASATARVPSSPLPQWQDSPKSAKRDSTRVARQGADSGAVFAAADSAVLRGVGPRGTFLDVTLDSAAIVRADDLHWVDYRSTGEVLEQVPGFFQRSLQSPGQYYQITTRGADWRRVAILQDGRILNDPASGTLNLHQPSVEYVDRMEIISGPRAFLYGLHGAGATVNLVTKEYDHRTPFSKINYIQSSYDYQYTDGTFSQNLARGLNMTIGFQQMSTAGRFQNSFYQGWNGRAKIRYTLSRDLSMSLGWYLTSTRTDLNGGLDPSRFPAGEVAFGSSTAVVNGDAYEKLRRNDLDLIVAGHLIGDSTDVTSLGLYSSWNLREYRDEENRTTPNGVFIQSDHRSSWMGARLAQSVTSTWQRLTVNANVELRQIEGSPTLGRQQDVIWNAWAAEQLHILEDLTVGVFGRYDHYLGEDAVGGGADLTLRLGEIALFAGGSVCRRLPSYFELDWTDSTVSRPGAVIAERHAHIEAGLSLSFRWVHALRLTAFSRQVARPIQFTPTFLSSPFPSFAIANGADITTQGLALGLDLRFWHLVLQASGTWERQRQDGMTLAVLPEFSGQAGLYYWETLLGGSLELKAGVRGRLQSVSSGELFNAQALAFVRNDGRSLDGGAALDLFAIAHIGDAYVAVFWENLTDASYYTTPYYVVLDRSLRFGIYWEFLD